MRLKRQQWREVLCCVSVVGAVELGDWPRRDGGSSGNTSDDVAVGQRNCRCRCREREKGRVLEDGRPLNSVRFGLGEMRLDGKEIEDDYGAREMGTEKNRQCRLNQFV